MKHPAVRAVDVVGLDGTRRQLRQDLTAAEEPLAEVDHAFTHFDLTLKPLRLVLANGGGVMDDARWLWYKAAEPLPGGIAAPIGRILREVARAEFV